jgi:hypothetical protein
MKIFLSSIILLICIEINAQQNTPYIKNYNIETRDSDQTYLKFVISNSPKKGKNEFEYLLTLQSEYDEFNFVQSTDSNKNAPNKSIPATNYKLYFSGTFLDNIQIIQNKLNLIHIYNDFSILGFGYIGNNRTIHELVKIVNLETPNDTIHQYTDYPTHYPLGKYYIEICTLPIAKFRIELLEESEYEFQIQENCYLIINDVEKYSNVELYTSYASGEKLILHITENYTESNPLEIQPGHYKITWKKGKYFKEQLFTIPTKSKFLFKFL